MINQANYIPGACNIGDSEIALRKKQGVMGMLITITLLVIFIFFPFNKIWRLIIFLPAFLGWLGFFQSREKFCVQYGILGVFNFNKNIGDTSRVERKYISQDRIKAINIILKSFLLTLLFTLLVYLF